MTIKFVGAYPVAIPPEERKIADRFADDRESVQHELSGLALVEWEVTDPLSEFDLASIHQEGSEWALWEESFYHSESLKVIRVWPSPTVLAHRTFRVAFYAHYYVPGRPFITPWGNVSSRRLSVLPAHLTEKTYIYWR